MERYHQWFPPSPKNYKYGLNKTLFSIYKNLKKIKSSPDKNRTYTPIQERDFLTTLYYYNRFVHNRCSLDHIITISIRLRYLLYDLYTFIISEFSSVLSLALLFSYYFQCYVYFELNLLNSVAFSRWDFHRIREILHRDFSPMHSFVFIKKSLASTNSATGPLLVILKS